jgi:DNA processing protein
MNAYVEGALEPGDVVLRRGDPGYPARLATTADAPPVLFVRGNVEVLELPAIALVGARKASDTGRARAAGWRDCSRSVGSPSPRAWRAASTRRPTAARWRRAGSRSP